jgi:hypothetical protein
MAFDRHSIPAVDRQLVVVAVLGYESRCLAHMNCLAISQELQIQKDSVPHSRLP